MIDILDKKTLGDYEMFVTEFPNGMKVLALQRIGKDFSDVSQQMEKQKVDINKSQYPSQQDIKDTLNGWIYKYKKLFVGSHNEQLTKKYKSLLSSLGYTPVDYQDRMAPPGTFLIDRTASRVSWFKTVLAGVNLDQLVQEISNDPNSNKQTLQYITGIPDPQQRGRLLGIFNRNRSAPPEYLQSITQQQSQKQEVKQVLSPQEQELLNNYSSISEWMKKQILQNTKNRQTVAKALQGKASQIKDWVEKEKPDLNSLNYQQAIQLSDKWHQRAIHTKEEKYLPTDPKNIDIQYPNGFTMQKITDGTDAIVEGKKMEHCVGNYCEDIEGGKIVVYSLRDQNNEPKVTIGLKYDNSTVVQLKGQLDTNPEVFRPYITQFFKKHPEIIYYDEEQNAEEYELTDLKEADIDNDKRIQKIVSNAIIREGYPPNFASHWANKILMSGNAPESWLKSISACIEKHGYAPTFADTWAKELLNSGQAPKSWERAINKHIETKKYPPTFAKEWMKKQLDSGQAPKEWIDLIIHDMGTDFGFGRDWVEHALKSGQPPAWLTSVISKFIEEKGYPPAAAKQWAIEVFKSGRAPESWMKLISAVAEKENEYPEWAGLWVQSVLNSGKAPESLTKRMGEIIEKKGYPPQSAEPWAKQILRSGEAPQSWVNGINAYVDKYGYAPTFANEWLDQVLRSGNIPESWMRIIGGTIKKSGSIPFFAYKWMMSASKSGQIPELIMEYIIGCIKDGSDVHFGSNFDSGVNKVMENIFYSQKIPESLINAITSRIVKNGEPPPYAWDWAREVLYSGKAPESWINVINTSINEYGRPPDFAADWVKRRGKK